MKYELTLTVNDYQIIDKKYEPVEAKVKFTFDNIDALLTMQAHMITASNKPLKLEVEKIVEEG